MEEAGLEKVEAERCATIDGSDRPTRDEATLESELLLERGNRLYGRNCKGESSTGGLYLPRGNLGHLCT